MSKKHPSAWDPAIMLLNILVSAIGAIVGLFLEDRESKDHPQQPC